ncbi:hypothetical protein [Niabella hibiscisoli]|uniref:hypothetical protein n=1 Tax=Niabella hibiscisoli TaxID=1825928 RepID=UPI001F0FE180|nr:hypothetical protein [Niabella hibiscisoli]MCH5715198.1 hypothetical protein [Niabella hibiscisoli]
MNRVITLANEIKSSGLYSVSAAGKYFDNFAPDNDVKSTENIYTLLNKNGERGGNVDRAWNTIAHYNMSPGAGTAGLPYLTTTISLPPMMSAEVFIIIIRLIPLIIKPKDLTGRMLAFLQGNNMTGKRMPFNGQEPG